MKAAAKRVLFALAPRMMTAIMSSRARAQSQRLLKQWGVSGINRRLLDEVGVAAVAQDLFRRLGVNRDEGEPMRDGRDLVEDIIEQIGFDMFENVDAGDEVRGPGASRGAARTRRRTSPCSPSDSRATDRQPK